MRPTTPTKPSPASARGTGKTRAPIAHSGGNGTSAALCPRCRGSFVLTCIRDGRVSVECPLCGRLWAEPMRYGARSRRSASTSTSAATGPFAGAAA